jgi:predicted O-methyltransferase YrrM
VVPRLEKEVTSLSSLEEVLLTDQSGRITIRPKVVFELVERSFSTIPTFTLPIPSSKIGSVTTLEASLISSLLYLSKPKVIFEFGTFLGYTTSTLLHNSSAESKVFSIDLPRLEKHQTLEPKTINWKLVQSNDAYNDAYLTDLALKMGERYLSPTISNDRLFLIKQDSLLFNPNDFDLVGSTDFIFLDGGHTDSVVRADTENSLRMLSHSGILIWHDYGSKIHSKVTDVVDEYSESNLVIEIKNTMLALTSKELKSLFLCN